MAQPQLSVLIKALLDTGELKRGATRAGQTLRQALGNLSLGNGLGQATRQANELQRALERIARTPMGRVLRDKIQQAGQDWHQPNTWDWSRIKYPTAAMAKDVRRRFEADLLGGGNYLGAVNGGGSGSWSGGGSGGGGSGGGAGGSGGGFRPIAGVRQWRSQFHQDHPYISGAIGKTLQVGGAIAGLATGGGIMGALFTGYRENLKLTESVDQLFKGMGRSVGFDELKKQSIALGDALQLASSDAAELAATFQRTSGTMDAEVKDRAQAAGQFGRGYGLDPNVTAKTFARAELVGFGANVSLGTGRSQQREMMMTLAEGIGRSGMGARAEQFLETIATHIVDYSDTLLKTMPTTAFSGLASMYTALYSKEALRGAGADSVVKAATDLGGGGEGGKETLAWHAYLAAGGDAGPNGLAKFERWKEAKPFEEVGRDGRTKFDTLMGVAKQWATAMPGGSEKDRFSLMLKQMGVASMPQGDELLDLYTQMQKNPALGTDIKKYLKQHGLSDQQINGMDMSSMPLLYKMMTGADLPKIAKELKGDVRLKDKPELLKQLEDAEKSGTLADVLPRIVAEMGPARTEADLNRELTAKLTTQLGKVGDVVNDLVRWLQSEGLGLVKSAAELPKAMQDLTDTIKNWSPWKAIVDGGASGSTIQMPGAPVQWSSMGDFGERIRRRQQAAPGAATRGGLDPLLDLIVSKEAGGRYDAVYDDKGASPLPNMEDMTIQEVLDKQDKQLGGRAIGGPQFIPGTLREQVGKQGFKLTDKFSKETQRKLAGGLIQGLGLDDWRAGKITDEDFHAKLKGTWKALQKDPGVLDKVLRGIKQPGDDYVDPLGGKGLITSRFGKRIHPKTGKPDFHEGLDLAASAGTPILAAMAGTVIESQKKGGAGHMVTLDHGGGLQTKYLHMLEPGAAVGTQLKAGDSLGKVGSTGSSTGDHLHFAVQQAGKYLDPMDQSWRAKLPGTQDGQDSTQKQGIAGKVLDYLVPPAAAGTETPTGDVFSAPGLAIRYAGDKDRPYGVQASEKAQPFKGIVFHHPGGGSLQQAVEYGQRVDEKRGGAFGYHFYVGRDGEIVQGAPMTKRTNHMKPGGKSGLDNSTAIGVSLIGAEAGATAKQLDAVTNLGAALKAQYGSIDPRLIYGHGEIQGDKRADEGKEAAQALRRLFQKDPTLGDAMSPTDNLPPAIPSALDRATTQRSTPEQASARWQGSFAMDVTFRDARGQLLQRRSVHATSEPRLPGTGDGGRRQWYDSVTMPMFG